MVVDWLSAEGATGVVGRVFWICRVSGFQYLQSLFRGYAYHAMRRSILATPQEAYVQILQLAVFVCG